MIKKGVYVDFYTKKHLFAKIFTIFASQTTLIISTIKTF